MKYRSFALLLLVVAKGAMADPISDAQNMSSFYKGSLQIDSRNPATTFFETVIPNQVVNMKLVGKAINSAFITELASPVMAQFHDLRKLIALDSAQINPTNFSNFEVLLDGCNISQQIVSLCNASNCWLDNPSTPHPVPTAAATATLGADFSMTVPINLNAVDFSQCPAETSSGFVNDKKYVVQFLEVPLDVCPTVPTGGRLDFEISVLNQSASSRRKGN
jgi:hypothetical protein